MKANWEARPLGDLVEVRPSKREAQALLTPAQAVSFVPMEDLKELQRSFAPRQERGLSEVYGSYTYFADGDVLLAKITPCFENGKLSVATGLTNGIGFGSSEFMVLRCDSRLDPEYLFYFLSRDEFREIGKGRMTGAVGHKRVPPEYVQSLPIPIPPLNEQKQIVAVLNEAFEGLDRARANAEANLVDARECLANETDRQVTCGDKSWTRTSLGNVVSRFEYGTSTKSQPTGSVPVLRMGNLQGGEIDWTDLVHTDVPQDIERLSLNEGDVLFNRTNSLEHVGKSAIIRGSRPAIFAGYLVRLHCQPEVLDPEFLTHFLNCRSVRKHGRSISGKSVNQANISAGKLRTYEINLPPLDKQIAIAVRVSEFRQALSTVQNDISAKLTDLDALRQSLLQKAFSGELT